MPVRAKWCVKPRGPDPMDPSRSISSFSNILREADSELSAMGSPGPQNAQICIRFRKSESARAVVVGVQTATSESPKVLHFWHFRTFGPEQIRESKSLLFQIQIWHFRHFRTRADSGVQISIVKDWRFLHRSHFQCGFVRVSRSQRGLPRGEMRAAVTCG